MALRIIVLTYSTSLLIRRSFDSSAATIIFTLEGYTCRATCQAWLLRGRPLIFPEMRTLLRHEFSAIPREGMGGLCDCPLAVYLVFVFVFSKDVS
jgi:hypothetical protein